MESSKVINDFPHRVINLHDFNVIQNTLNKSVILGLIRDEYYPYLNKLLNIIDPAPVFPIKARIANTKQGIIIISPIAISEKNLRIVSKIIPYTLMQLQKSHSH